MDCGPTGTRGWQGAQKAQPPFCLPVNRILLGPFHRCNPAVPEGWDLSPSDWHSPLRGASPFYQQGQSEAPCSASAGVGHPQQGWDSPEFTKYSPFLLTARAPEWASGPPAPVFLGHAWDIRSWTRVQAHSPGAGSFNHWTTRKSQAPLQTWGTGHAPSLHPAPMSQDRKSVV